MLVFPYRYGKSEDSSVDIVSWTDGTAAQIKAMLDAEKAGKINTSDYLSVGDKRTFHLSAISALFVGGVEIIAAQPEEDVEIALAHKGLYIDVNNLSVCWVVSFVDCLYNQGKMNGTNINSGSWDDCGVYPIAESSTGITFEAADIPDQALTFKVCSMEVS